MGPFPHDAPAANISADNPMGTDGFEFVEYAHPKPEELHALFRLMGYVPVARHNTKKITVYRQGDINYLVNEEPGTHGFDFVAAHGPCAPSMAFRVVDAKRPISARCRSARSRPTFRRRRRRSMFPPSRASAAACCISSTATAPRARPTMPSSNGWARKIRGRKAPGYSISIISPITSIAAAWMSGPASTKGCSISARSAFSISRAARPACSRGR